MKDCFTVLTFNNVGNAFISVKTYKRLISGKDEFINEDYLALDDLQLKNGLPINASYIAEFIEGLDINDYDLYLCLNCDEIFKITTSMPHISLSKAKKVVGLDIKTNYPDLVENYDKKQYIYATSQGYLFYDYLIPKRIIDFFKKIFKEKNIKYQKYVLYPEFLLKTSGIKDKEYVYAFNEHGLGTLILNYNGAYSYSTFAYNFNALNQTYYQMVSKHQYELEKKTLDKVYCTFGVIGFSAKAEYKEPFKKYKFELKGLK